MKDQFSTIPIPASISRDEWADDAPDLTLPKNSDVAQFTTWQLVRWSLAWTAWGYFLATVTQMLWR